jgi:transposase
MPAPYSLDLRQKAVPAVERGERKSHICKTLNISRNTLDLWLKRREETGSLAPKRERRPGVPPKISDLSAFKTFAQKHGHLTQQGMAELWPTPVSRVLIAKALRKIGFTRKTNPIDTENVTKPSALSF